MTDAARKQLQDEILAEVKAQGTKWQEEDKRHQDEIGFIRGNVEYLSKKYWEEVAGVQIGQVIQISNRHEVEVTGYTWYRHRESITFTLKVHPLTKDYRKARNRVEQTVWLSQITRGLGR